MVLSLQIKIERKTLNFKNFMPKMKKIFGQKSAKNGQNGLFETFFKKKFLDEIFFIKPQNMKYNLIYFSLIHLIYIFNTFLSKIKMSTASGLALSPNFKIVVFPCFLKTWFFLLSSVFRWFEVPATKIFWANILFPGLPTPIK